jgi:hypothetical protein
MMQTIETSELLAWLGRCGVITIKHPLSDVILGDAFEASSPRNLFLVTGQVYECGLDR